jgi:tetratricopeptide (TPR) repeat protein
MRSIRQIIFTLVLCLATGSFAASREETHAFKSATKVFSDHVFSMAERNFSGFIEKYPTSDKRNEAILFAARSQFYQNNYQGTIDLLTKELSQAGVLRDQYHFWIGESYFASGNFEAAAKSYREVLAALQPSSLRLEAAYNEALAFSKLKNWARVTDLLGKTDGDFQTASKGQPDSEFVLNGNLLLAETFAAQDKFPQAEAVLVDLGSRQLNPMNQWRRQFLATKILLAQSRLDGALQGSTNLLQLASVVNDRNVVGESIVLQGEIFERLNRLPEAVDTYQKNLAEGLSADLRRRALFKTVELTLRQGKSAETAKRLQTFIDENPQDPALDVALLSLGEIQLRQYFEASEVATNGSASLNTNLVQQALTNFTSIKMGAPESQFLGKALLDIGWCFWTQNQLEQAEISFAEAFRTLPVSEEKAIAVFKRADCQFQNGDFINAAANYDILVQNFGQFERVKNVLVDQALYQIVRSGIALTNQSMAEAAAHQILGQYPNSYFADRSLLLFGQGLNRHGKASEARATFSNLVKRFPDSALNAQAEWAIARTYVQEKDWTNAVIHFENWEAKYTGHPLVADAQFSRALALAQVGRETNTLALLTSMVARFSSNSLAARAESWIADYYFNAEEYVKAESHYQEVLKHNPAPELKYQASLMAGRAAYERQGYEEARKNYFEPLINNTNTPPSVLAETFFALGDTIFKEFLQSPNKSEDLLSDAISALTHAINISTNSPISSRAWGRIGDMHLQWGMMNTNAVEFVAARDAYEKAADPESSDVSCRNQAEVGLGRILEKQNDFMGALIRYRGVIDGDESDPYWVKEAGIASARILELREEWDAAVKVYERIGRMLPALAPVLEKKIAAAQTHRDVLKK